MAEEERRVAMVKEERRVVMAEDEEGLGRPFKLPTLEGGVGRWRGT